MTELGFEVTSLSLFLSCIGEGNGNPLQCSCLGNPRDGGAWWAAVCGVAQSRTRLSDFTFTFPFMHWRRTWQPTPAFLPGESQGRGSLVGCHLWGRTETDTTSNLAAAAAHASKVMLKILQDRLQQYVNCELPGFQAGFRKARETRDQTANIHWIIEKAREFQKKNIFLLY